MPYPLEMTHRHRPGRPGEPARYVIRIDTSCHAAGFGLLLVATLGAAFVYISGLGGIARRDPLYAVMLTAVWGGYFASDLLLRVRLIGPVLAWAGRAITPLMGVFSFGLVYWLILGR